jgi:ABC-type multidrug transport system fused ATPase/permease subunit
MKNIKDTILTILRASKYSLKFCLRNSKGLTLIRLFIAIVSTILGYLAIQFNGQIINAVQLMMKKSYGHTGHSFIEFIGSGLIKPVLILFVVFWVTKVLGNYEWFFRNKWNQILRFANRREMQEHRATLDIARIRSKQYDDIQRRIEELPSGWFTRITFAEDMMGFLTTLSSFIIFGTSLLWYNWIYAVVILITSLPMISVEFRLNSMWWNLFSKLVPEHKKRFVLERPYGGTTAFIQALMFNQMPTLRKQIDRNIGGIIGAYEDVRKSVVKNRFVSNTLSIAGLAAVIAHASWMVIVNSGGIGTLTIIIGATRIFQGNISQIVGLVAEQWNTVKGIILIEEDFFGLKSMLKTEYPVVPPTDITPEIRFENVSFTYPGNEKSVLDGVSFTLIPGSKTAIVGASGNGKSTIQFLLMRHYDPTSGAIFANSIDLKNIRPADWSKVVSGLTQSFSILERPIGEEIASSRMDDPISLDALMTSCRFARFDSVVESDPKGFDSQIGTEFGGREFSGGEQQRLALARVHYRGTPVLIFDEPDSDLDPESAEIIIDNIISMKGVTVVIITHHVSRAEICDNVIVMGKGKILEQGTHQELMTLNGAYVSMRNKDRERLGTNSDS